VNKRKLMIFISDLNLPKGEFVIFGGASLTVRDLRDCLDLDLFITDRLYNLLLADGWVEKSENDKTPYLTTEKDGISIQAFRVWEGGSWKPNILAYLRSPEVVEGLPFMPLDIGCFTAVASLLTPSKHVRELLVIGFKPLLRRTVRIAHQFKSPPFSGLLNWWAI
jgi:hypothetical protein